MKKRVLALIVALLVLSMGTVAVSAAVSPSAETATVLADAVESEDGDVEVLAQDILADVLTFVDESVEEIFGVEADDVDDDDVYTEVKAAFDFTPSAEKQAELAAQGYVDVSFAVDVVEGANVVILHYTGIDWEIINPISVADGVVTGRFTGFSPIVIVELTSDTVDIAPVDTPQGGVAPQTGEVVSLLCVAAASCLAGAFASRKKAKKN